MDITDHHHGLQIKNPLMSDLINPPHSALHGTLSFNDHVISTFPPNPFDHYSYAVSSNPSSLHTGTAAHSNSPHFQFNSITLLNPNHRANPTSNSNYLPNPPRLVSSNSSSRGTLESTFSFNHQQNLQQFDHEPASLLHDHQAPASNQYKMLMGCAAAAAAGGNMQENFYADPTANPQLGQGLASNRCMEFGLSAGSVMKPEISGDEMLMESSNTNYCNRSPAAAAAHLLCERMQQPGKQQLLHGLVDLEHLQVGGSRSRLGSNPAGITSPTAMDVGVLSMNHAANESSTPASCSGVVFARQPKTVSSAPKCKLGPAKKRKSQQKKVVCVPATGGPEKPTGECVPPDSYAWRKYGQKPIKGSPYPRSYYRCSTIKGCTARKQVERNPSDPLMIIITYTCDHNHDSGASSAATSEIIRAATTTSTSTSTKPLQSPNHEDDDDEEEEEAEEDEDPSPMDNIKPPSIITTDPDDPISDSSCCCEPNSSSLDNHNHPPNHNHLVINDEINQEIPPPAAAQHHVPGNLEEIFHRRPEDDFYGDLDWIIESHTLEAAGASSSSLDPFELFLWSS